jgi:hypothetical protein
MGHRRFKYIVVGVLGFIVLNVMLVVDGDFQNPAGAVMMNFCWAIGMFMAIVFFERILPGE